MAFGLGVILLLPPAGSLATQLTVLALTWNVRAYCSLPVSPPALTGCSEGLPALAGATLRLGRCGSSFGGRHGRCCCLLVALPDRVRGPCLGHLL